MSKYTLGTVQFGMNYGINNKNGQPDKSKIKDIFDLAHDSGIVSLDSAEAYGIAHTIIGDYHRSGKQLFNINSKFSSISPESLIDRVKYACELLAVEKLSICFYHSYAEYKDKCIKPYFNKLLNDNLVEQLGVSVYTNDEFEDVINDPDIKVIQIPFNPFDNFFRRGNLILKAKENGKRIQVRSIFLQGLFFISPNNLKGKLVELKEELIKLNEIAQTSNMTMSNLCLQYALHYKQIDDLIIGVDTCEQLSLNLLNSTSDLSLDVIESINNIRVKNNYLLYPYNWK